MLFIDCSIYTEHDFTLIESFRYPACESSGNISDGQVGANDWFNADVSVSTCSEISTRNETQRLQTMFKVFNFVKIRLFCNYCVRCFEDQYPLAYI